MSKPVVMRRKKVRDQVPTARHAIWDLVEAAATSDVQRVALSRNEAAYSSIKRMILTGQLGPGRKLVHEDMAEALNVSRTPVREALERLFQEGFVTRLPRRGFYVVGITRDEAMNLYGAREALELYALSLTFERGPLPRASIKLIRQNVRRYEQLINMEVPTERILADILLHLKLAELSGNRYVVRLLAQTFERLTLKRRLEGYRNGRVKTAAAEHAMLAEAIARHDKKLSLQILRNHIRSARDALLSQLYDLPEGPFGIT
jgi:DNA-binding GntR family transcriptional regulator